MDRRKFIQTGTLGALVSTCPAIASDQAQPTPQEIMGPFYPVIAQTDKDFDLTQIEGRTNKALGQHIVIIGHVFDTQGKPVKNATVDLWQANAAGRYRHPHDSNPAPVDDNFQGWAIIQTQQDGRFQFKTVLPGAYPVNRTWTRPPHVHFKVTKKGYVELITQMYFPDHELNNIDRLLQRKNKDEQKRMIAEKSPTDPTTFYYNVHLERA